MTSAGRIHHVMKSFRPKCAQKRPETITSHDVKEPSKQALGAVRDVIFSRLSAVQVAESFSHKVTEG